MYILKVKQLKSVRTFENMEGDANFASPHPNTVNMFSILTFTQDAFSFVSICNPTIFKSSHFLLILTDMSALKVSGLRYSRV